MNTDKHETAVALAGRAKRILEDDMVVAAFDRLEKEFTDRWRKSGVDDRDGREEAFRYLKVVERFRQHFERLIEDGKLAESALEQLRRKLSR